MLKLLAALFMVLDHIGFYFYDVLPNPLMIGFRTVGRLAFPIFAFTIARGFSRTRHLPKYGLRLAAFALVTEAIVRFSFYLIALQMAWTNVLVTFSLSIAALAGYRLLRDSSLDVIASLRPIPAAPNTLPVAPHFDVRISLWGITLDARIGAFLGALVMLVSMFLAEWLKADYGAYGILMVLAFFLATDRVPEAQWERQMFVYLVPLNLGFMIIRLLGHQVPFDWAVLQLFSLLAIPLIISLQREKRPPAWQKYGFYAFYPLHIFLICLIRYFFIGPF